MKNSIKSYRKSPALPIAVFVFILGFCIMLYPFVGQLMYYNKSIYETGNFEKEKHEIRENEIQRRMKLAKAYNSSLNPRSIYDPFTEKEKQEGRKEYARMIEIHEKIGHIKIPRIQEDIPVYAGTGESVLKKGAGHMEGTSLPIGGKNTHCVISAHRGLPTARLFTDLDKLSKHDVFYIYNIEKKLAYEVDDISIVEPSDFSRIKIERDRDYVTLLTCTPYMVNSHRLLVRGHRIKIEDAKKIDAKTHKIMNPYLKKLILLIFILVISVLFFVWISKLINKKSSSDN